MREFLLSYNDSPVVSNFVFDLQLFAAEDEGRTEEPTETKIRRAREKGQVAKTLELPQSLVVIFGILVLALFFSWICGILVSITKYYLSSFSKLHLTQRSLFNDVVAMSMECAKIVLPIFVAAMVAAVIGSAAQVGFQISTHPLKMDFNKIKFDPATIMRKVFFSKQIAANLFKSIAKVLAIGFVAYLIISSDFDELMTTADVSIGRAILIILTGALKIIIWTSVILLILSIPDYFFQKREFIESLKMTKAELKEEYKESSGDPFVRAKLRDMQRAIIANNMNIATAVPKADVVVTNPTHFAVAILYDSKTMAAPTVTAKGVDSIALAIRKIARENNVPTIENRPLAQILYKKIDVGQQIPQELLNAVVAVYKTLSDTNRLRASFLQSINLKPRAGESVNL